MKKDLKPMLSIEEMLNLLKSKNIKFNYINEDKAKKYLKSNNNYFNLTSYKNNFEKYYVNGIIIDKHIDLDFAYLIDLSEIDYELRILLFIMIMNIEHFLKLRILNIIEQVKDNGYDIVNEFLNKDFSDEKRVHKSIFHKVGNEYHKEIFRKYDLDKDKKLENIPIWEFLEIITFGELLRFYEFFAIKYKLKKDIEDVYILKDVVKIRNAVYHNTNILCNLNDKDNGYPPKYKIVQYLKNINVNVKMRNIKLSNSRIRQLTYTLFMFNYLVNDKKIKSNVKKKINNLFYKRIKLHKEYYNNNELLKSIYSYFDKIISKDY